MAKFGVGQPVRRVEDQRFLTGQGRYVDDIVLPGMCHGVVLLSPHAHARIRKIDTSKAKAAPGVLLVLTGADAAADKLGAYTSAMMPEDIGAPKGHRIFQQVLQAEKVRFVGDRVAFVVAETAAQARDAAEMIEVDYETLPAVALLEYAAKDGAPKVWDDNPNGNVAFMLMFGAATFLLLREFLGRLFGDQFPYLIPLGVIFIAIIIFLPQGLLGFMRRWLNK